MKRIKGANWKKRILSAALALGMVLTMFSTSDVMNIVNAAGSGKEESLVFQGQGVPMRTRAVLDDLPIPEAERSGAAYDAWLQNWYNGEKGTYTRPFLILELVPYYEQGSFGWLIDGCEPIDVKRLSGNTTEMSGIECLEAQNFFDIELIDYETYFFPDETEGKRSFYTENGNYRFSETEWDSDSMTITNAYPISSEYTGVRGYWEVVEKGKGTHYIKTEAVESIQKKHIVPADPAETDEDKMGTLVWHTIDNKFTIDKLKAEGYDVDADSFNWYMSFEAIQSAGGNIDAFIDYLKLTTVGSRYYTRRIPTTANPLKKIPANCLYSYKSNDVFVRDTLGKTSKYDASKPNTSSQEYSVWVKTITPKEFNDYPQWADICDLVIVERYNHTAIADLYKKKDAGGTFYNRFKKAPNTNAFDQAKSVFGGKYTSSDYSGYNNEMKDIKWSVAEKLFKRVAASKNFIGIVFDKTVRDVTAADTKSVAYYRYDLSNNRVKKADGSFDSFNQQGYKDNIFKLWMLCTSTRPNLVDRFYFKSGKIVENAEGYGVFKEGTGRTAEESLYWGTPSFFYADSMYPDVTLEQMDANSTYWTDYLGYFNNTAYVSYVQSHTYTYNGDQSIYQTYHTGSAGADVTHFDDFNHYITTNSTTANIWRGLYTGNYSSINSSTAQPWIAIRYILELDVDDASYVDDIYVLDIEPSVGLGTDRKPVWKLTENDIALMVPSITSDANIKINHMISGSFVGRNEDLNATYDLIYIGDDASGFWSGQDVLNWKSKNSNWGTASDPANAGLNRTNFYDNTMDGLVYFHIGDDYVVSSTFRPNYMYNEAEGNYVYDEHNEHTYNTGNKVKQPGNDFTSIKVKELKSYIKAEYPIVAAKNLYETGATAGTYRYVDASSLLWGFLTSSRATLQSNGTYKNGVYFNTEVSEIDNRVRLRKNSQMKIESTPTIYQSVSFPTNRDLTAAEKTALQEAKKAYYLTKSGSYGVLNFTLKVPNTTDYSYRIYLDQDRNGKFSSSEIVQRAQITSRTFSPTVYVTDGWVGFIQWKVEIYKTANEDARVSKTGCSAIEAKTDNKNKILALQITPNDNDVDLSTHTGNGTKRTDNKDWTRLYDYCTDFEIEVYKVKYSEFEKFFRSGVNGDGAGYGFTYDMSKDINTSDTEILSRTNPNRNILELIENKSKSDDTYEHRALSNKYLGGHVLYDFNMIVIGFRDSYGGTDISNQYGCAEYLFYFADAGKSLLFTHDLAHYRNEEGWNVGVSATTMLRDIMGMNRYGVVNFKIVNNRTATRGFNVDGTCTLAKHLKEYNTKKGIPFETTSSVYKQGYTYANLVSKVGQNAGANRRAMYKYHTINPQDNSNISCGTGGNVGNSLAYTDRVQKLNEGQITQYPFNIPEVLSVNKTHYQYYQLNMEDPELTVWFTLEDPYVHGGNATESSKKYELIYGVTPQEAANNYYIYSKGNIFYSGVGHSGISGVDERELFVNTLIAAYRPTLQEPEIIITNVEAVRSGKQYTIRVDQEFDYDEDGNRIAPSSSSVFGDPDIEVTFIPRDYSGAPNLKVRIFYEGESQFFGDSSPYLIYKVNVNSEGIKSRGAQLTSADKVPGVDHTFLLNTESEYMIVYQKSRLGTGDAANHIIFEAKNDRVEAPSKTDLFFKPRPLFLLD